MIVTVAEKPTKFNTCCAFIVNILLGVFFGIYAFNNPDDSDCYVIHYPDGVMVTDDLPSTTGEDYTYKDLGRRYKVIFCCGIVLCLINLVYAVVAIVYFMVGAPCILKLNRCLVLISGLFTIAWISFASFVTFNDEEGPMCDEAGFLPQSY